MQLSELPDDMLLEVLARLPPRDLLRSARAVDRRWRALALHPGVWQHQHLHLYTEYESANQRPLCKLAMRLAPSMGRLVIQTSSAFLEQRAPLAGTVSSCNCAVAHLQLDVDGDAMTCAVAGELLRRQADLGRLRSVRLRLFKAAGRNAEELRALLLALDACDLSSLSLDNHTKSLLPSDCFIRRERRPLRSLSFRSSHVTPEPLLEALLAAHQASLEYAGVTRADGAALRLLSRSARLREAKVPFKPELGELLTNRTLTALHLDFSSFRSRSEAEANANARIADFFKEAVHLKSLRFCADHIDVHSKVFDAIKLVGVALASSGRSLLERLAIEPVYDGSRDVGGKVALPSCLPGLPRLHTLVLTNEFDASLLKHLDASSAPSLRVLRFTSPLDPCGGGRDSSRLSQRACKFAAVRDLLRRLPEMHLHNVLPVHQCERWAGCDCCLQGLHTEARLWPTDSHLVTQGQGRDLCMGSGLYAHGSGQGQPCGLHDPALCWVRLEDEAPGSNSEGCRAALR